jgi:glutamate N-acetyltransferase/amino-acid N-acetyltransferase
MQPFPPDAGVPGFRFGAVTCGIKNTVKKDLGIIVSDRPCSAAGVFTRNRVKAAPVHICRRHLAGGTARAVIANSGNANACTGAAGADAARRVCRALAGHLGLPPRMVLPCSTGVIGVPFPADTVIRALPDLVHCPAPGGAAAFAEAIMTTDTRPKITALRAGADPGALSMLGIAKGSGMIMPDMATMLAFIVTDAAIEPPLLKTLLQAHAAETFNRISVDGDMSTNDTVLILAGNRSRTAVTGTTSRLGRMFDRLLFATMDALARMIVLDGEGATKLITIRVVRAPTEGDALKAARRIANSCLVKTAFFGEDFNWGRIMGALGSSGARVDQDRVCLSYNGIPAVRRGVALPDNIPQLKATVKKKEIELEVDLQAGRAQCRYLTCDLSYEYVKINADYTT